MTAPAPDRVIPVTLARHENPAIGPNCNGCDHCVYSAPGGQRGTWAGRPAILDRPHSRCGALDVYVPMTIGEGGKWISSELPEACPIHGPQHARDAWTSQKSRDRAEWLAQRGPDAPKLGRPSKPDALTPAERARRYRERRAARAA